jgi:dTDP-4-dehydrorhamnose reductase
MPNLKRVIVTGSNGLLGQAVVRKFRTNYYLIGCDLAQENFNTEEPPHLYYRIDLTKRSEIKKFFAEKAPDIIINTAAYTAVDGCEEEKELCWSTNVKSVELIIEACETFSPIFVQISTDYVFDGNSGPYRETDKTMPLGYYGLTKYSTEKLIRSSNLEYIIARTMILYGTGPRVRPNFVTWVIDQLRQGNKIQVVNDQIGNPTLADDLAEAIYRLIEKQEYGIFHISGRESCSRYEFACIIADVFSLNKSLIQEINSAKLEQKAPRPLNSSFILDKLNNTLDWIPEGIEESLKKLKSQLS